MAPKVLAEALNGMGMAPASAMSFNPALYQGELKWIRIHDGFAASAAPFQKEIYRIFSETNPCMDLFGRKPLDSGTK